jgi:hypothetical protein
MNLERKGRETLVSSTAMSPQRLRQLGAWVALGVMSAVLAYHVDFSAILAGLGIGDFIAYWAAGRLNALGENPYSWDKLHALQLPLGQCEEYPNMMYYPPWTLALVMPFGMLPFAVARLIWLLAHLALVIICAGSIWRYYGGPAAYRWCAWALALVFVPTLIALRMGQIGPLLLLGIVGFLWFEKRGWDWLAGAALMLPAIKPQLVYLFGVAVLVWAIDRRRWGVVLGGALTLSAAVGVALAFNPGVISDYRFALANPPSGNITPTVGAVLRLLFGEDSTWLQYVPTVLGLLWFPFYWTKHRATWSWGEQAPLLVLVSFLTTAYGAWVFDLVVLLLPLLHAAAWTFETAEPKARKTALAVYLAIDLGALAFNLGGATYPLFIWMTPAILVAYLALRRYQRPALTPRLA